jgi:hypothetical protein
MENTYISNIYKLDYLELESLPTKPFQQNVVWTIVLALFFVLEWLVYSIDKEWGAKEEIRASTSA